MMNNNYFNKTESSKTYTRQNLTNYHSVYVKKWVDYSSKYGLGYLLSDGTTGIYFNDSTKMIIDETGQYF
jgi:polo-like kinase 1